MTSSSPTLNLTRPADAAAVQGEEEPSLGRALSDRWAIKAGIEAGEPWRRLPGQNHFPAPNSASPEGAPSTNESAPELFAAASGALQHRETVDDESIVP